MKANRLNLNMVSMVGIFAGVVLLAGCAETATTQTNTKPLLTAAGFRIVKPETPKQKEIYASVPAYRVERAKEGAKVFYVYKDEKAGVAYVGNEAQYQQYKQLCQQQKMAESFYMSENMDRIQSHRFYGEWGASVIWR